MKTKTQLLLALTLVSGSLFAQTTTTSTTTSTTTPQPIFKSVGTLTAPSNKTPDVVVKDWVTVNSSHSWTDNSGPIALTAVVSGNADTSRMNDYLAAARMTPQGATIRAATASGKPAAVVFLNYDLTPDTASAQKFVMDTKGSGVTFSQ